MEQKLMQNFILLERAFFGKDNCFIIALNSNKECYFRFGVKKAAWEWKKIKISDVELADILAVIEKKKPKTAFYHKFNETATQIWVNSSEEYLTIKVRESSKSFSIAEQQILKVLIERMIWIMNAR